MAGFDTRDVKEILDMLEDEISFIPKLPRVEKMKMRSKIRKQANWLLAWSNPTAEIIYHRLEERLSDVFSLYPYGVSDKVKKLLKVKSERLLSKSSHGED
jgi:hypothetical protein